ncbi:hypothetical protein GCM10022223_67030 [Kineosporia mesophila]|uniref:Uncharacterized protein n=1 Tax=Kineosporia mesophila TaxID=566012 RepID=A0ABP7AR91_9ACTN|nr:hypothetical protein [Kineosporia mesophila]MCD5349055.1 hypothetical protein [Kineosporia mesophila]
MAGAADTALFVTVMARTSAASENDGFGLMTSVADEVHAALMWGGIISTVAVVPALLVRRPGSCAGPARAPALLVRRPCSCAGPVRSWCRTCPDPIRDPIRRARTTRGWWTGASAFCTLARMTRSGPAQGFSLCNPDNDRPSDLPRLLRRLADRIDDLDLDPVEILDMTVHQETTGDGPRWWATVYFATEALDPVDLTETAVLFDSADLREHTEHRRTEPGHLEHSHLAHGRPEPGNTGRGVAERDLPERDLPERDLPERDLPEGSLSERSLPEASLNERSLPERPVTGWPLTGRTS